MQADASKKLCEKLAKCKDPVCSSYYNDPDVERICGICTMAANGWYGCFAGHSQASLPWVSSRTSMQFNPNHTRER